MNRLSVEPFRSRRRAFTLVEMLVVIGIIIVLVGILIPVINLVTVHSTRNRMQLDIQTLKTGLEAYKADHKSYPIIDYNDTKIMMAQNPGAVMLCWALIAPGNTAQDGAGNPAADVNGNTITPYSKAPNDGPSPGFSVVPKGQVYGPYVQASQFKLGFDQGNPSTAGSSTPWASSTPPPEPNWFIADRYGHPIMYFKANDNADIHNTTYAGFCDNWTPSTSTNPAPKYNIHDNLGFFTWPNDGGDITRAIMRVRIMLGDLNNNGQIDGAETPVTNEPYLLWCAGPDELPGVDVTQNGSVNLSAATSRVPACDDATSFTR